MSLSPEFMAFLKKNELLYLLDELNGEERWVYRPDCDEEPYKRDVFGRIYINRAYDLAEIQKKKQRKEKKRAKRKDKKAAE